MGISEFNSRVMELFSHYPPVSERLPLPPQQIPIAYAVVILAYFFGPGFFQTQITSYVLMIIAFYRPFFTSGDVVTDYTMSSMFFVLWIMHVYHAGNKDGGPRYIGNPEKPLPGGGVGDRDSPTYLQKLKWAVRLTATPRGIGWDWQVKNVPPHPGANLPPLQFVWGQVVEVVWRTALKAVAVYVIGVCKAVQLSTTSLVADWLLDTTVAWCGAVWSWNTIGASNAAGAAITVMLGICEPWEWPPVFGSLGDAWSVRQVWSTSYHQLMRKPFQFPGLRLARFLCLKKGTFGSRYLQLYSTFYISCCIHRYQSYIVSRHENGEFAFFMLQPVIISVEDFLRWVWRKSVSPKQKEDLARFEVLIGYFWTIAAFTFTLRYVIKGWVGIGLIGGGGPDEKAALQLGLQHGTMYLQGW
ncbi:membrane bound O-acyl transferase family-domain-containing protein [Annulohypoxylon maeteangense]|uniref:membrane bound O-acyl transferase family-domain-containing protein n=1 Tax=Annulohypoxylon maeteangense TaxID=1927788 RepID=UPI002007B8FB|nr:membrane bound O-acyl transferase family-domain-containing protein [Annulohypoxylon maeteangense]KAI0883682.1 membrane bound O-acyl transferase family-domain-containing protein [Annulohypoxylon maeteangense]